MRFVSKEKLSQHVSPGEQQQKLNFCLLILLKNESIFLLLFFLICNQNALICDASACNNGQ